MSGLAYHHTLQAHLASILLSQSSITQLCEIYDDGLHGERCMADAVRDPGVVLLDQQFMQKTCLVTSLPRIWKSSFGSNFSILSHWFNISGSHNAQTGGWSLHLEITRKRLHLFHASGDIHYAKLVHLYHLKLCTLQDWHRQGWIPFLHRGRLLHHPMQRWALGWCLVWHDHRTSFL